MPKNKIKRVKTKKLKKYNNGDPINNPKNVEGTKYGSNEYFNAYHNGTITNYSPELDLHVAKDLPQANATAEAPFWLKKKKEFEKKNPKPAVPTEGPRKALGVKSAALIEWEKQRDDYIVKQIEKKRGLNGRDVEKLNKLPIMEQKYLANSPKYQTSYYRDFVEGVKAITPNSTPTPKIISQIESIKNNPNLTNLEKKERLTKYLNTPYKALANDALGIIAPLTIPAKVVQSAYKDNYSIGDALGGTKNNAGLVEDILTDPLTYTGTGLGSKLGKVNKLSKYSKPTKNVSKSAKNISKSNFKSEIDWVDWVKKNNPTADADDIAAIKANSIEYDKIEEATKADGTWMKNPDGSDFKGTKEQFVQQQSSKFKNNIDSPLLDSGDNIQLNYHGGANNIVKFQPQYSKSNNTGAKYGKGLYTTPDRKLAKSYADIRENGKVYELYQNAKNKQPNYLENINKEFDKNITTLKKELNNKNITQEKFDVLIDKALKDYDKKIDNILDNDLKLKKEYDYFKADEVEQVVPFSNNPKSALGNNGNFDMSNPNIYKAITIPVLGASAGYMSQKKNGGQLDNMKKYNVGGVMQAAAPFVGMLPGVGTIAAPILAGAGALVSQHQEKKIQEQAEKDTSLRNYVMNNLNNSQNNYGFMENGGQLTHFEGPKHEQGGIPLPHLGAEVEGGETMNNDLNYVNSDHLGYDKDGYPTMNPKAVKTTFAEKSKKIEKRYKKKQSFEERAGEEMMQKIISSDNEKVRPQKESQPMMENGGFLEKYNNGGKPPYNPVGFPQFQTSYPQFSDYGATSGIDSSFFVDGDYSKGPIAGYESYVEDYFNNKLEAMADYEKKTIIPPHAKKLLNQPLPTKTPAPLPTNQPTISRIPTTRSSSSFNNRSSIDIENILGDRTLGDRMNLAGAGIGMAAQLPALFAKPETVKNRTYNPKLDYTKYNERPEMLAAQASYNKYRSDVLDNTANSSTANARLLAGLSSQTGTTSNILRNKQQQDYRRTAANNQAMTQARQYSAREAGRVDDLNARNRQASMLGKQQSLLNIGQQMATTGQYFNELDTQKMQLGVLNDLYSNYGLDSVTLNKILKDLSTSGELIKYRK